MARPWLPASNVLVIAYVFFSVPQFLVWQRAGSENNLAGRSVSSVIINQTINHMNRCVINVLRFTPRHARKSQVMGLLMKEHKAEMDGKIAQRLVSAKLKGAAWSSEILISARLVALARVRRDSRRVFWCASRGAASLECGLKWDRQLFSSNERLQHDEGERDDPSWHNRWTFEKAGLSSCC